MSVNKVILIGHLGGDPEVRYMPNGEAVANFSMATTETWKDRNGERQSRTEWHKVVLYRRLAEIAGEYLKKGSQVFVEGRIQSRKYTGKDNIERTAYEIIAETLKMLGGKNSGSTDDAHPAPPSKPSSQGNDYAAASRGKGRAPAAPRVVDDLDDDIPF